MSRRLKTYLISTIFYQKHNISMYFLTVIKHQIHQNWLPFEVLLGFGQTNIVIISRTIPIALHPSLSHIYYQLTQKHISTINDAFNSKIKITFDKQSQPYTRNWMQLLNPIFFLSIFSLIFYNDYAMPNPHWLFI